MKLKDIITETTIKTPNAYLSYKWNRDLLDEEDEDYLPVGYDPKKVLELEVISVYGKSKGSPEGMGYGTEIMKKFLASPAAQKAELIFLDLNPHTGEEYVAGGNVKRQEEIMDKLETFYKKFGFRNNSKHRRMWLVRKGTIPDNELPS